MTELKPLFEPPHAAPWLEPYWEGLRNHELRLPRCSKCGQWEWYPLASGPACAGAEYVWQAIEPMATVFTFTRVNRPLLPGVSEPYVTGLVVPDEAPNCRIAARLDPADGQIRIGSRVRLAFAGKGDRSFPYFVREDDR